MQQLTCLSHNDLFVSGDLSSSFCQSNGIWILASQPYLFKDNISKSEKVQRIRQKVILCK